MSRDQDLKKARNKAIKDAYNKLSTESTGKTSKYKYAEILKMLGDRFYFTPNTIEKIILKE
jgi:hypothetical protein